MPCNARSYIDERDASTLLTAAPPGAVTAYAGASAPDGWLMCDGSAVSRATYADLFAVSGVLYGSGDGSTTFNLPDLRQRFPLGKAVSGTGSTLGGTGGSFTTGTPSATVQATILVGGAASTMHTHDATPPFQVVNYIIRY